MTAHSEYGRALFLLAKEDGLAEEIKRDCAACLGLLRDNPEYAKILDTPAIAKEERLSLADEALAPLHEYVRNLVKLLAERRAVSALPEIYKTYLALYNEDMGIEEVEAISAIPMTDAQLAALKGRLEAKTGKTMIIRNTVDPSILGGVKLRYEGKQIDGSVKTRLDGFAESLREVVI